jgi:undecaprenyl-diphosphatase
MNIFESALLGILQGLTEFIPVSSTAHLLIAQHYLGVEADDVAFAFNVLIQLGTLLSLVIYFWKDLWKMLFDMFRRPFSLKRLGWYVILATIPALISGVLLKRAVETLFRMPLLEAAIRLLITTVILLLVELLGRRDRNLDSLNWLDALFIGAAQVLAVFHGASRSGTTIGGGMARGLDRPSAARFAFLMSVPVMLAAGVYESLDLFKISHPGSFLPLLAIGFVTAAIVGWLAVRWLLDYLNSHSLFVFVVYCAIVGVVCLVLAIM